MSIAFDMPRTGPWELRGGWVVRRLVVDLGLADYQAAGIVGNLGFESVGFTKLHEIGQADGVGGYGWAQWTGPRRVSFFAWCNAHALAWGSDEANYGYLQAELSGDLPAHNYAPTVTAVKRCVNLGAAVFSVGQTYERPGGTTPDHLPGYEGRLSYAKRALAAPAPPSPAPTIHPDLRIGASGSAVAELQRRLTALGYPCGAIDAAFGARTDEAAERFQKARGIWPGVTVNGSTWNALARAEADKGSST